MLYFPTKLNNIAERINEATVAWLTAAQNHDPNEMELNKEVGRINEEQDEEEARLRDMGFSMLYDYERHVYYAMPDSEIKNAPVL